MKAQSKVNAPEKEKEIVKVPAKFAALVSACFKADSTVKQAQMGRQRAWEQAGEYLAKEYPAESATEATEGRAVLKQAFTDAGKDPKDIINSSYISKIMVLAYPKDAKSLQSAKADGLETEKLLAAARGSLKKKGNTWVKVEKKGGSGGHNKGLPADNFAKAQIKAFTDAQTAKLKLPAIARMIMENAQAAEYDLKDLLAEMETQAAKLEKE